MEPIAYKYIYPLFFGLGGLGLFIVALSSLIIAQNPREKGGIVFLLTAVFFFPPWLCVIIPSVAGWIRFGNAYYLWHISVCLGVVAFLFLVMAWFENRRGKIHGSQVSMAISGIAIFLAWLALLPQVLTNFLLVLDVR